MARHLAPFSCRQRIAEIVRRRSWGGVLPLGRHASISGSRSIHAPSVSIALSSFQEGQNARHHNQFKLEQALARRNRDKLKEVRALIGPSAEVPLVVADSNDPASLRSMAESTGIVISTVGPYQLYGS